MRSEDRDLQDKNSVGSLDWFAKTAILHNSILTHVHSFYYMCSQLLILNPLVATILLALFFSKSVGLNIMHIFKFCFACLSMSDSEGENDWDQSQNKKKKIVKSSITKDVEPPPPLLGRKGVSYTSTQVNRNWGLHVLFISILSDHPW